MIPNTIVRRPLLAADLNHKNVTRVDVREIVFEPGRATGLHRHPCPVFGYVAEGEAVLEVQGEPVQKLPAGSAFYEPAGKVIARFDNASPCEKMRFICYYLLEGKQELIEMLPPATEDREHVFIAD
jgi:quercetin dioxygenase-like cupin family protein